MKKTTIALIVGIVIFFIGCIPVALYEQGVEVTAKVTRIETKEESDSDLSYTYLSYTLYGDYTVNGKEYKDQKLNKVYEKPELENGTYKVVVNPESGKPMYEGGILCVAGFITVICALICARSNKKKPQKE